MKNRYEDNMQIECVRFFKMKYPNIEISSFPAGYVFAGDKVKRAIIGKRMIQMGYRVGSPDLFIMKPTENYSGLFIELKTETGRQSDTQKEFQKRVERNGYAYVICRSLDHFIDTVNNYLKTK